MGGGPEEGGTAIGPGTRLADDGKRWDSDGRCSFVASAFPKGGGSAGGKGSRLRRETPWRIPLFLFFSSLFFVSVFGLVLGAFWVPFSLLVELLF